MRWRAATFLQVPPARVTDRQLVPEIGRWDARQRRRARHAAPETASLFGTPRRVASPTDERAALLRGEGKIRRRATARALRPLPSHDIEGGDDVARDARKHGIPHHRRDLTGY